MKGVKSVIDNWHIKETNKTLIKTYASDAVKYKRSESEIPGQQELPSQMIKSQMITVETIDGIVQLSGKVENATQITRRPVSL
ncbi:MAG: Osmotically-inducible protein Y [Sodalis sp.]|nr:MAG: Osmotically-inducible protein Y [Sodalis sp.]